jgi:flagellar protein FlbD
VISVHHYGRDRAPFYLNPDLITTIEERPDTHITLSNGRDVVVVESPTELVALIRMWRASVMSAAATTAAAESLGPPDDDE